MDLIDEFELDLGGQRQAPKHPTTPEDAPFESIEDRRSAVERQLAIRQQEREGASPQDIVDLDSETARLNKTLSKLPPGAPKPAAVATKQPPAPKADLLDEFELDVTPSWWDTLSAFPGTLVGRMKESIGGVLQSMAETDWEAGYLQERNAPDLAIPEQNPSIKIIAKKTGKTPQEVAQEAQLARSEGAVAEWAKQFAAEGRKRVEQEEPGDLSWETPADLNFWKAAVLTGGTSLLAQLPGVAASVLTRSPAPGVASAMAQTYGGTYSEARAEGIEPGRAGAHAGFDATVEGVMEYIPLKFLTDHASGPLLHLIVGTLVKEVPTEVATTILQSANAKLSTNPDMTGEEFARDILMTAGSTLVSAPLLGAIGGGVGRLARNPKAQPARVEPSPQV